MNDNRTRPFSRGAEYDRLWGILLAGGDGKRLQSFVESLYGYERPKQFCAIIGTKSMLRHTLDRAGMIIPSKRILAIVNEKHLVFAREELAGLSDDNIIAQPRNCETGPGVLLPLLHVHHRDPNATVALFPSDHYIREEGPFMEYVRDASEFVDVHPDMLVVLGIKPDKPESGYGWIEATERFTRMEKKSLLKVRRFCEKPEGTTMQDLYARGCLWNTMLTVGKTSTFLDLFKRLAPEIYSPFQRIYRAIGMPGEEQVVREVFRALPSVNFSRAILERSADRLGVMRVEGIHWSDWGDQERILGDLDRIGRIPEKRKERQLEHAVSEEM